MTAEAPALLVVDDEAETRKALRRELGREWRVYTASSAAEAERLLHEHAIGVVISDERMPGTSGADLLRAVRDEFPDTARMLLTAHADIDNVLHAVNAGGVERYLRKPWDRNELREAVREAFARRRLLEDNRRLLAELRQANDELEELHRLRRDMLCRAGHDLRNVMALVRGFSALLGRDADPELRARHARRIDEGVTAMARMLDDLMDAARIADDSVVLQVQDTDLAALVTETAASFEAAAAQRSVTVAAEIPAEPLILPCDPSRIGRALANLIGNAVRYAPPDTTVTVRLSSTGGDAMITVQDQGPGIAPEDLPHVFRKYWRGAGGGELGLGLSIAKDFVERHGGAIDVESEPGRGARFRVTLPRPRAAAAP